MPKDVYFDKILHGGDYNPEQWPEDVWDDDVRLMQLAHVNVATLPVFGWVTLQPAEDKFEFGWLDRVIEKLHAGGVDICMATATGSVPAWMDEKYPDVLRVNDRGQKTGHGGRHVFCPSSPNFRRLSVGLARRLAERYGNHPALKVWHISNEYSPGCYCNLCAEGFRAWLGDRYGSLDEVNRRWNASFWGHTYTAWSQIEPPTHIADRSMQSLLLDYDRFQSHAILEAYKAERDVLRSITPDIPITTNMMGTFKPLNYQEWAKEVDIVSWDSYPHRHATPSDIAFAHSAMRGLKEGQPFMLMEQTPSQQNWQHYNALKRPGVMRLWSYQAMAHGADTVMYFQWRRSRGGCEKYHGAVVEHAGTSEARVFREVATLGKELESLGTQTLGGRVAADVAVLFDWENWWAIEYSSGPSIDLKYHDQCSRYFKALHGLGIPTDIVSPEADLSKYKVLIAPVLYMVKPGVAERLEAFVHGGGTLVTTFFSGIVDETDLVYLGGYPGPLRKLLGIWSEEIDVLSPEESNKVLFEKPVGGLKGSYGCRMLCDLIHPEGAEVLATYTQDFYAGEPALTVNAFGSGKAYYVATVLDPDAIAGLMGSICDANDIAPAFGSQPPSGVEVIPRRAPSGEMLFYVLNHNSEATTVDLPGMYVDLITKNSLSKSTSVPGYGVLILKGN